MGPPRIYIPKLSHLLGVNIASHHIKYRNLAIIYVPLLTVSTPTDNGTAFPLNRHMYFKGLEGKSHF